MEILSAYLIIPDYANREVRIINTQSYSRLIFHLLLILKNMRQPGLHFTHVIDSVDLSKFSSREMKFFCLVFVFVLICRLYSPEPYH